jgi:hypothetical protein
MGRGGWSEREHVPAGRPAAKPRRRLQSGDGWPQPPRPAKRAGRRGAGRSRRAGRARAILKGVPCISCLPVGAQPVDRAVGGRRHAARGGPADGLQDGVRAVSIRRRPGPRRVHAGTYTRGMARCSSCRAEGPDRFHFCEACGAALASAPGQADGPARPNAQLEAALPAPSRPPASALADASRALAGTALQRLCAMMRPWIVLRSCASWRMCPTSPPRACIMSESKPMILSASYVNCLVSMSM